MLSFTPLSARPISVAFEAQVMALLASAGGFALAGQDVALSPFRKLIAEAGALSLVGSDIQFLVTFSPVALNRIALRGTTAVLTSEPRMKNDFAMVAGDTKTVVVTVVDANGNPVNISGVTIAWRAARSFRKTAVITKTTGAGVSITNGPNGVFTVMLAAADTEDLAGDYVHEAQVTDTQGNIATVIQGTMKVNPALIRAS